MIKTCLTCNKKYKDSHPRRKYCSRECIKWGKGFFKPKPRITVKEYITLAGNSHAVKIPLASGEFAIVDEEDFSRIAEHRWQILKKGNLYARSHIKVGGKWEGALMHRLVMNAKPHQTIDHINGNGLDNRKVNLRFCNASQNAINRKRSVINTSGIIGVIYHKGITHKNRWHASITIQGKRKHLGSFATKEEAIKVRQEAEKKYYGEFTRKDFTEESQNPQV